MANGKFNRGSSESGRKRDGSRLPGQSAGEGTSGNVIPRPTTKASIRRQQALMRILSDKLPNGSDFSRGTTKGGVRRNFAMMANMSVAGSNVYSVQLVGNPMTVTPLSSTSMPWFSENYDIGDWWTSGIFLTCPGDGTYTIAYQTDKTQTTPSTVQIDVVKNGASIDTEVFASGVTALSKSISASLVAGDTLRITVLTSTGGDFSNRLLTVS
jgi:hypothetical protein